MRKTDQHYKDKRDRGRFLKALGRGLDLAQALKVATDGGHPLVGAQAALSRVERALRAGHLGVRPKKHLGEGILKALVGEGYLRVEKGSPRPGDKKYKGDPRFAPWVRYHLTAKGRTLLQSLEGKDGKKPGENPSPPRGSKQGSPKLQPEGEAQKLEKEGKAEAPDNSLF